MIRMLCHAVPVSSMFINYCSTVPYCTVQYSTVLFWLYSKRNNPLRSSTCRPPLLLFEDEVENSEDEKEFDDGNDDNDVVELLVLVIVLVEEDDDIDCSELFLLYK